MAPFGRSEGGIQNSWKTPLPLFCLQYALTQQIYLMAGAFVCGVCMFSLCLCPFCLGALASSYSPINLTCRSG